MDPVLDLAQLQGVTDGDVAFEKELFDIFCGEYQKNVESLHEAIMNNDQKNAILHSHDIKGSSANIGAVGLKAVAAKMEELARKGELTPILALIPSVQVAYEQTTKSFKEYFAANGIQ